MIMQTDYIYLIVSERQLLLVALFCGSVKDSGIYRRISLVEGENV